MLKNTIKKSAKLLITILSYIIPKKKGYLVFQPIHNLKHLSGNIKAMLIYAGQHYAKGDIVLVAFEKAMQREAEEENIPIIKNRIKAYWNIFFRAELVIIDATVPYYSNINITIVQLWHGTGFKNIGLLNDKNEKLKAFRQHYKKYKFVIATSAEDKKRKEESFEAKAIITGSPRNDIFFKGSNLEMAHREKFNLQNYDKVISYVPTFRDYETKAPFSKSFWKELNAYLTKVNQVFIVKKHPWDKYLEVPEQYGHIIDLSGAVADVQDLLIITDLLITDYSGIISDYVLTNRPALLYMYDYNLYLETCRSSYYDLDKILPRPFAYTEEEVLAMLKDVSWAESLEYQKSYSAFKSRFHDYLDGNSSERVMREIEKLM